MKIYSNINSSYNNMTRLHLASRQKNPIKQTQIKEKEITFTPDIDIESLNKDHRNFQKLSREQLATILLNKNKIYTKEHQSTAESYLHEMITDVYNKTLVDNNHVLSNEAAIEFMDKAGPLEKQTLFWNKLRALAVTEYQYHCMTENRPAKNYDIDKNLYNRFKKTFCRLQRESSMALKYGKPLPDQLYDKELVAIEKEYYRSINSESYFYI